MDRRDSWERVLASLHDAALEDGLWPGTSRLIDEVAGIMGNALVVTEGPVEAARVLFAAAYYRGERRPDLERDYLENYHNWDERVPRLRRLPDRQLAHITQLYTDLELKTSRSYNEFSLRSGGGNSLNVRLDGPGGSHITWVVLDPVKAGWQMDRTRMIERLLPHVRHFVHVRQALAGANALGASFGNMLDHTGIGVIQLDRRGRIVETNDRARQLLRQDSGLREKDGSLHAWLPTDDTRLRRRLAAALPALSGQATGGSLLVRHPFIAPGLTLHVHPVTVRQQDFGAPELGALVLIAVSDTHARPDATVVGSVLGLTPAESRVAVWLAEGKSVPEIAVITARAESSVRTHLKRMHRKLGISRRADLVRKVLSVPVRIGL